MWPFDSDPAPANQDPDAGFVTRNLSNPWVGVPYAVLSGLAGAASPATARLSSGLNQGLGMVLGAEGAAYSREKEKRLSDTLGKEIDKKISSPVDTERPGFSYAAPVGNLSDYNPEDSLAGQAPMEMKTAPVYTPQQQNLLNIMRRTPEGAKAVMGHMATQAFKAPAAPHFDRDPVSGRLIAVNPQTLEKTVIDQGTPKEPKTHVVATVDAQGNPVHRLMTEEEMRATGGVPSAPPTPPSLDDNLVDQGLADLASGQPLSRRVMNALGTDDPNTAKAKLMARDRIRRERDDQKRRDALAIATAGKDEDIASPAYVYYDKATRQKVFPTKGELKKNRDKIAVVNHTEGQVKDLADTLEPNLVAMEGVLDRVLASGGGANLTNAIGNMIQRGLGSNEDLATFDTTKRITTVELSRLFAGSQRPAVTLMTLLEGAVPADKTTIPAAKREIELIRGDVRNRQNGIMGLPMEPLIKPKSAPAAAPPAAIDFLKKNPQSKEQFKAKYGYLPEGF